MQVKAVAVIIGLVLGGGCVSLNDTDYVDLTKPRPKPVYEEPLWNTFETTPVPVQTPKRVIPKVSATVSAPAVVIKKDPVKPVVAKPVDPIAKSSTLTAIEVQQALQNAGYYNGKIDGKIGAMSQAAIKKFQTDKSMKVDGIVGGKTSAALTEYLKAPTSVESTADEPEVFTPLSTTTELSDMDSSSEDNYSYDN